jgi:outer membrane protein OmpA-like peptidoglycan-associated protein
MRLSATASGGVASNNTEAGRQQNRRAEVVIQ